MKFNDEFYDDELSDEAIDTRDFIRLFNQVKKYLTEEDLKKLIFYVDNNLSPAIIGRVTGCSRATAYKRVKSHINKICSKIPDHLLTEIKRIL